MLALMQNLQPTLLKEHQLLAVRILLHCKQTTPGPIP